MQVLYKKPDLRSYSANGILEELGPCQNQYTTTTLYTTEGNSSVNVDGMIASTGQHDYYGIMVGDISNNEYLRGLFGFDISSIQSTVISATLSVYQFYVWEIPCSDSNLGTLVVDHVNFGSSLGPEDFDGGTLTSNIGTISNSATVEWKTLDVKNYVQADLDAGRTSSQFRLRFTINTDGDSVGDYAGFEDSENYGGTTNRPKLVVTYQ